MIIFCLFVFNCCIFFPQFSFHNMVTYLLWWEGTFLGTFLKSYVFEKIVLFESYSSNFSLDCHVVFTFTLPNFMICSLLLVYALSCVLWERETERTFPLTSFSALGFIFACLSSPIFSPMEGSNKTNFPSLQCSTVKLENSLSY